MVTGTATPLRTCQPRTYADPGTGGQRPDREEATPCVSPGQTPPTNYKTSSPSNPASPIGPSTHWSQRGN